MRIALDPQPGPMLNLAGRYAPELLAAAGAFSVATYKHSILPIRVFEAARIAIAGINGCTVCQSFRTAGHSFLLGIGADEGVRGTTPGEDFYAAILADDLSGLNDRERIAVEFARGMSLDPQGLAEDEALWARLKAAFGDEEVVDLTYCCAGWIGFGRAIHVLGVDRACALPEPRPSIATAMPSIA